MKLRRAPQAQPLADLASHERRRAVERARRVLARRSIAEARVEHARVLQVGLTCTRVTVTNPTPGIVQLARDHRRHFGANLIGDAIGSGSLAH